MSDAKHFSDNRGKGVSGNQALCSLWKMKIVNLCQIYVKQRWSKSVFVQDDISLIVKNSQVFKAVTTAIFITDRIKVC